MTALCELLSTTPVFVTLCVHYRQLYLHSNALSGTIPASIGSLTELLCVAVVICSLARMAIVIVLRVVWNSRSGWFPECASAMRVSVTMRVCGLGMPAPTLQGCVSQR